jgi:glycolate oxidase
MLAELVAELPDGTVVTDPDIVASYRQDRASDPDAGTAIAVVRPRRTEEVQAVLRWASKHGVPVVPRGAGTGLSGGATALNGGIVLSTERMRDIFVDPVTRTAVTQPGLFNAESRRRSPSTGCGIRPTRRRTRSAASAATSRPMPAACAA